MRPLEQYATALLLRFVDKLGQQWVDPYRDVMENGNAHHHASLNGVSVHAPGHPAVHAARPILRMRACLLMCIVRKCLLCMCACGHMHARVVDQSFVWLLPSLFVPPIHLPPSLCHVTISTLTGWSLAVDLIP